MERAFFCADSRTSWSKKKLHDLEKQCIQECAPPCTAMCPLHVDLRTVISELARGSFDSAIKVLRRTLPFPGIIGRICEHPCQDVCKRVEAGGNIAIAALERASTDFGEPASETIRPLPGRGKKVAVIGGGLSGATAALDLFRKGYGITIIEATSQLGGATARPSGRYSPDRVIDAEFALLTNHDPKILTNTIVGRDVPLDEVRSSFDALYTGTGKRRFNRDEELYAGPEGMIVFDPATFGTNLSGVFIGGARCSHRIEIHLLSPSLPAGARRCLLTASCRMPPLRRSG